MITLKLIDAPLAQVVVVVTNDFGDDQVRCWFCRRIEGAAQFRDSYTPVETLALVQGALGQEPRYVRGPHVIKTELPKSLPVVMLEHAPFQHTFERLIG